MSCFLPLPHPISESFPDIESRFLISPKFLCFSLLKNINCPSGTCSDLRERVHEIPHVTFCGMR